jgi:hypothetical protein
VVVEVPVDGVVVVAVPVARVVPVVVVFGPVVEDAVELGVVIGVTGFGGATSWRSRPPGHATAPATATSATTLNAIGNASL